MVCEQIELKTNVSITMINRQTKQRFRTKLSNHNVVQNLDTQLFEIVKFFDVKKQLCFVQFNSELESNN